MNWAVLLVFVGITAADFPAVLSLHFSCADTHSSSCHGWCAEGARAPDMQTGGVL